MRIENLTKKYKNHMKEQTIFSKTSFDFKDYNSIALCGRSGSGKSTLLSILAGIDIDYVGDYFWGEEYLEKTRKDMANIRLKNISLISQDFCLLYDRSVYENLAFPLKLFGMKKKEISENIIDILKLLELDDLINEYPAKLSGGEKQRIAIARSLIIKPKYIFADEPTSELDELTEKKVLEIFKKYQQEGTKFLIATHSKEVANSCEVIYNIQNYKILMNK